MTVGYSQPFKIRKVPNTLPSWVPAPGQVAQILPPNGIAINQAYQALPAVWVNAGVGGPGYSGSYAGNPWRCYGNHLYAPDFSALGGIVNFSTGHDFMMVSPFIFDLSTLTWSATNAPAMFHQVDSWGNTPAQDPLHGYDPVTNAYVDDGSPAIPHQYLTTAYMPTSLGGGPKGSLIATNMQGQAGYVKKWDLSQANGGWSVFNTAAIASAGQFSLYANVTFDSSRVGWWRVEQQGYGLTFFRPDGTFVKYPTSGSIYAPPFYFDLNYYAPADILFLTLQEGLGSGGTSYPTGMLGIKLSDVVAGTPGTAWRAMTQTGPAPGRYKINPSGWSSLGVYSPGGFKPGYYRNPLYIGMRWSTILNCYIGFDADFAHFPGSVYQPAMTWPSSGYLDPTDERYALNLNQYTVYKFISPPLGQEFTGTWTWTTEQVTPVGMTTQQYWNCIDGFLASGPGGTYAALVEVPAARCLVLTGSNWAPPLAFRLSGM